MSSTSSNPNPPSGRGDNDPFLSLRRGMDRLFDQVMGGWGGPSGPFAGTGVLTPKVDVAENAAGLEISAELPGIEPKDVAIDLQDDVLTLRAERSAERREEDREKRWHVVERQSGTYLRRFALPFEPEADKVEASFDKGVLHIRVPRPAPGKAQARRIEVRGG